MIKIKIGKKQKVEGAVVVVVDSQDRVLILLRPSNSRWAPDLWGFPGGKLEKNETPLNAAIRETLEETQLRVRNLRPLDLKIDKPVVAYYTREYGGTVKIDWEHEDWAWVGRNNLSAYKTAPDVVEMFDWVLENE